MKKAVSLILILGIVASLFSLAACGDDKGDMTSLMDEGSTLLSDIGDDLSENLSEALSDEGTSEEESTEDKADKETTLPGESEPTSDESTSEEALSE